MGEPEKEVETGRIGGEERVGRTGSVKPRSRTHGGEPELELGIVRRTRVKGEELVEEDGACSSTP